MGLIGRWFDEPHPWLTAVESLTLWPLYVVLGGTAWLVAAIVASLAFVIAILVTVRRRGEAQNRQAQAPLPASVSATPEGSQRGRNDAS